MRFSWRLLSSLVATLLVAEISRSQETNPAIEQARLFPRNVPPTTGTGAGDGVALPQAETTLSEDESFGAQQILKAQEKIPQFALTSAASLYYTNNVALTRSATQSDGFFVGEAGFNWTPRLSPQLQLQLGGGASVFRYFNTSALDFENLGFGGGIGWAPEHAWGLSLLARYDFTELLDRHSSQILQDHEFSAALQKVVVFGRSHALNFNLVGSAGIADPVAQQREQVGFGIAYHLQVARQFGVDFGYRHSWFLYNEHGRTDLNQIFSVAAHYRVGRWVTADGFVSGALNNSNQSVYDYKALTAGGGVALTIRF